MLEIFSKLFAINVNQHEVLLNNHIPVSSKYTLSKGVDRVTCYSKYSSVTGYGFTDIPTAPFF